MKKLLILFAVLSMSLFANSAPLFGVVKGVASDDELNIRAKPNYRSKKIASIPNGAYVGIEQCKHNGHSRWCRIFPLTQMEYSNFAYGSSDGWVNAKFLRLKSRGYVVVDNRPKCDYALRCIDSKCKVVVGFTEDKNGNIAKLKSQWIDRSRVKGESKFGAVGKNGEGYCASGNYIEDYLVKSGSKSLKLYVEAPSYLHKKILKDGSVKISKYVALKHYNGCDERDEPPLLYRYSQISLKITPFKSFSEALKYISVSQEDLNKGKYFGLKGYKLVVGVEGCGIEYYIFKKYDRVVLVSKNFNHNPPRLSNGKLGHYKKLSNEERVIRDIVRSIKFR